MKTQLFIKNGIKSCGHRDCSWCGPSVMARAAFHYLGMLGINLSQVALYNLSVEMINKSAWYHVRLTSETMKAYGIDPS